MKILNLFMAAVITATVPMHSFAQSSGDQQLTKSKVSVNLNELEQKLKTAKELLAEAKESEQEGYVQLERTEVVRLYSTVATISSVLAMIVSTMKYSQNALTASSILFFSGLAVVFSNELTAKSQQKKILLSKEKIIELNKEIDTLQTSVQVTKSHLSQIQQ